MTKHLTLNQFCLSLLEECKDGQCCKPASFNFPLQMTPFLSVIDFTFAPHLVVTCNNLQGIYLKTSKPIKHMQTNLLGNNVGTLFSTSARSEVNTTDKSSQQWRFYFGQMNSPVCPVGHRFRTTTLHNLLWYGLISEFTLVPSLIIFSDTDII